MTKKIVAALVGCLIIVAFAVLLPAQATADNSAPTLTISGYVHSGHGEGVVGATVSVAVLQQTGQRVGPSRSAQTHEEGAYIIRLPLTTQQVNALRQANSQVIVDAHKSSFADGQTVLRAATLAEGESHFFAETDIILQRKPTAAVFLSALVLIVVYIMISFERLHRTVAALLGASAILIITHVFGFFSEDFIILPFERAVTYVDFNVIFLLMAMMVLVTIAARTGVFQWLAVGAYRRAGGSVWRLVVLLMVATAFLSAILDNVTTMLLVVPVTLEIALILRLNVLALLLPEVFASNIGGAATLIGDPPNLLIGSYANLGFEAFLIYMTPAVVVSMILLVIITRVTYKGQYPQSSPEDTKALLQRLSKEFRITDMRTLRQSLIVFGGVVILFILSSVLHMEPSVPALVGMVVLLVWTDADIVQELEGVEWPSLLFFIGLFIVVGAANETGVIEALADGVASLASGNLVAAILLIVWITAIASMLVDNIPITATMLPVVAYLTHSIPGASSNILYWALAFGACFGGNGTIVGASANIVTVGLAERAGYPITFGEFARKGLPVTVMSLVVASIWLLVLAWLTG